MGKMQTREGGSVPVKPDKERSELLTGPLHFVGLSTPGVETPSGG